MASRRDQLQSYQFLIQRVISALVMRETDPFQSPLRRGVGAVFAGMMIAVIVAAVFGVVGLLTKVGSQNWKTDGSVVVERETGAVYWFHDDTLHPMANYASALLASGKNPPSVFQEPANSLTGVARGVQLGIPGAPNSLPATGKVVGAPWALCSVPATDDAGNAITKTMLVTGRAPTGGQQVGGNNALLAKSSSDGSVYLVWHSHAYPIDGANTVLGALFQNPDPVLVGAAWLSGLPPGVQIGALNVDNGGSPSAKVPNHNNGDLLYDQTGSGPQYFVVVDDGLAPITQVQQEIYTAVTRKTAQRIDVGDAQNLPHSDKFARTGTAADPPATVPPLTTVSSTDQTCATFTDAKSTPKVVTGGSFPNAGTGIPTQQQSVKGANLVDLVTVPPGHVAVVHVMESGTAQEGSYTLVTDNGMRFPVPSAQVLQTLGYNPGSAIPMPASLVNRIPQGPTLSPTAAQQAAASNASAQANAGN